MISSTLWSSTNEIVKFPIVELPIVELPIVELPIVELPSQTIYVELPIVELLIIIGLQIGQTNDKNVELLKCRTFEVSNF